MPDEHERLVETKLVPSSEWIDLQAFRVIGRAWKILAAVGAVLGVVGGLAVGIIGLDVKKKIDDARTNMEDALKVPSKLAAEYTKMTEDLKQRGVKIQSDIDALDARYKEAVGQLEAVRKINQETLSLVSELSRDHGKAQEAAAILTQMYPSVEKKLVLVQGRLDQLEEANRASGADLSGRLRVLEGRKVEAETVAVKEDADVPTATALGVSIGIGPVEAGSYHDVVVYSPTGDELRRLPLVRVGEQVEIQSEGVTYVLVPTAPIERRLAPDFGVFSVFRDRQASGG